MTKISFSRMLRAALMACFSALPLFAQEDVVIALSNCRSLYYQQNYSEALETASKIAEIDTIDVSLRAEAFLIIGVINVDLGSSALGENSMRTALQIFPKIYFNQALYSLTANELFHRIRAELVWDLKIDSDPSAATLFLDDKEAGKTPLMLTLLRGKNSTLMLKNPPNYKDTTFICGADCLVEEGTDSINVQFERTMSQLAVTSTPPQADIFLDNIFKGTTPDTLKRLYRGENHTLELKKLGFNPINKIIVMDSNLVRFDAKLPTATGFLVLRHYPPVAQVSINAKEELSLGQLVREMPTGSYALRIFNPGYKVYADSFKIRIKENMKDTVWLCIELGRLSRLKAVFLSFLWPGAGQYYSNRPYEAAFFSCAAIASTNHLLRQYSAANALDHGPSLRQRSGYMAVERAALWIHAANILDTWLLFPRRVNGVRPPLWKRE